MVCAVYSGCFQGQSPVRVHARLLYRSNVFDVWTLNEAINKLDVTIQITDETWLHTQSFLTNCVAIKSRPCVDGHYIKDLSPH